MRTLTTLLLVTWLLALAGCGAKTALDPGSPPGSADAGPPLPVSLDACHVGADLPVVSRTGRLDYPALARLGDRALLVWARTPSQDAPWSLESIPITLDGRADGAVNDLGHGEGATLVAEPATGTYVLLAMPSNSAMCNASP